MSRNDAYQRWADTPRRKQGKRLPPANAPIPPIMEEEVDGDAEPAD